MDALKFNSQICTTKEQGQRLLDLGLKPETADMSHQYIEAEWSWFIIPCNWNNCIISEDIIPAWSLHRLIEMCNKTQIGMTIGIYNDEVTADGDLFEVFDNTYDNLISVIEWLIKGGHFNEQYLKQ